MSSNHYASAGWFAIAAAVLFPSAFVVGVMQDMIKIEAFGHAGPILGPADILFLMVAAIGVYTAVVFRRLVNERYSFHEIDTLITASIWWNIVFQIVGLLAKVAIMILWPVPEIVVAVVWLTILALGMITVGIIDIMIAIRLLRRKEGFNELIRAYAYLTIVSGVAEVSIILAPIALLLVPVNFVLIGMIFLREKEEVEFV